MDVTTFTAHRRSLDTPAGEIAYTELGAGPVALFVHGLGTNGVLWRHVIENLRDTSRCIAIDLPLHGGTPGRDDLSVTALAQVVADLCDGLGLAQVDLVGNDTGGAIAQIFAARHPDRIRSFTLTNCDCEGNFPPAEFVPVVELAQQGMLAAGLAAIAADPAAWPASPLGAGFEHPELVPEDVWRSYVAVLGDTTERARDFERMVAALVPAEMDAVSQPLRALDAPTLLVWGTGDATFGVKWAYHLRDLIPGAREVVEVDGAKIFFPEERPDDLIPHLRRHWGR
ncbi:MAG TPA: alpha/beta hydrolase [Trebonia sp.]|jgi:pimeloyl-ACP methyl ester carboxylesterase|nr:alpha/beta hydrolase [Trebonia sp.]